VDLGRSPQKNHEVEPWGQVGLDEVWTSLGQDTASSAATPAVSLLSLGIGARSRPEMSFEETESQEARCPPCLSSPRGGHSWAGVGLRVLMGKSPSTSNVTQVDVKFRFFCKPEQKTQWTL
jgi:hypothetical protein